MNFRKLFTVFCFLIFSTSALTHEGHESGTAKSMHGGIVKKTKNTFIEVIQDEGIEIYISNHDYKNMITPKLVVTAFSDVKGKKTPLKLDSKNTHFVVGTDLKKEKHFKLNVLVKVDGKEETAVFPLEN